MKNILNSIDHHLYRFLHKFNIHTWLYPTDEERVCKYCNKKQGLKDVIEGCGHAKDIYLWKKVD